MRLVIFDVDGTLIDSQHAILSAMGYAFEGTGLDCPGRDAVLGIVGLSLPEAMARLMPHLPDAPRADLVERYKSAFGTQRLAGEQGLAPLYPGALDVLDRLAAEPETLLAVATGKSRRGLDHVIAAHGLEGRFLSLQTADGHPSKPHPAMIHNCLAETGVSADRAVMIGDTSFDMEMAANAGVAGIGVTWGYHPAEALRTAGAARLVDSYAALPEVLDEVLP